MANNRTTRNGRTAVKPKKPTEQLELFGTLPNIVRPSSRKYIAPENYSESVGLDGEVIDPPRTATGAPEAVSSWTLGQREHDLLVREADKNEAQSFKWMKAFIVTACIDVAVNCGLPVAQALLKRYELPLLSDGILSGALGLAAIAFACATLYFYARFRASSLQLRFDLAVPVYSKSAWPRRIALTLGTVLVTALGAMLLIVLLFSATDMLHLLRIVIWHLSPSPWETKPSP